MKMNKKATALLSNLGIILFWLLVWEGANALIPSNIIIVSPRVTFARLFQLAVTAEFWYTIGTSLERIMHGFLLALGVGVLLALISARFKLFYQLVLPAVNVINATPIASFVVIAIMAVGTANLSHFVSFVTVLPIVFFNTYKGIVSTDPMLLEMANVFNVPLWKRVVYIYFKTTAPYIVAAAQVGIGFAWKSGIAAELIGLVRGTIGFSLHTARSFLLTADIFAWTITIILLSYLMEKIFLLIFGRVIKWKSD